MSGSEEYIFFSLVVPSKPSPPTAWTEDTQMLSPSPGGGVIPPPYFHSEQKWPRKDALQGTCDFLGQWLRALSSDHGLGWPCGLNAHPCHSSSLPWPD